MPKITKDFVDKAQPTATSVVYWDERDKGYGLRVSPFGRKAFIVTGRVRGCGKAVSITLGPASMSEAKARAAARVILYDKFRNGIDPREEHKVAQAAKVDEDVAMTTLGQVRDAYHARPGKLKDSTKAEMSRHVDKVFAAWVDKPIAGITEADVRRRYAEMAAHGLSGKPAPGQAQMSMVTLRTLVNFASRRYKRADGSPIVASNPVAAVREDWQELTPRTRDIENRMVGTAWMALQDMRLEPRNRDAAAGIDLTMFLLLTGARRNEGAALTRDRVNLSDDPADCWWHLPDPKNRNPVWLPLSSQAVALLRSRVPGEEDEYSSEYVFPSRSRVGHVTDTRAPLERVSAAVGMERLSAHDLRRTFVSVGFAACGIDLFKLELLTGHKPQGVTARHYLQTQRLQYLQPEVQRIGDWIEEQGRQARAVAEGQNVVRLRA